MDITLERYHGLGNDYLVYDPNKNELELNEENVKMLCNRNMGLGADGILEGPLMEEKQMAVRIWNPNGSIAEKSGNGVRIFAKYLKDAGYVQKKHYTMLTDGGEVEITYLNEEGSRLKVSMGKLSFWSDEIPVIGERRQVINEDMVFGRTLYPATCVSIGNPHCVIPMQEISEPLVCKIGRESERARYFPNHINTELMNVIDMNNIAIETYERRSRIHHGKRNRSMCGSRCCVQTGTDSNKVIVHMPGGELQVEIGDDWEAYMTGDVFYVAAVKLSSEFVEMLRAV